MSGERSSTLLESPALSLQRVQLTAAGFTMVSHTSLGSLSAVAAILAAGILAVCSLRIGYGSWTELVMRGRRGAAMGTGTAGPGAGTGRPVFLGLQMDHMRHPAALPTAGTPSSRGRAWGGAGGAGSGSGGETSPRFPGGWGSAGERSRFSRQKNLELSANDAFQVDWKAAGVRGATLGTVGAPKVVQAHKQRPVRR